MRRQDWQGSLVCQQLVWLVPTGRLHDTSYNCKKKLTSIKRFRSFTGKSSMNLECIRGPRLDFDATQQIPPYVRNLNCWVYLYYPLLLCRIHVVLSQHLKQVTTPWMSLLWFRIWFNYVRRPTIPLYITKRQRMQAKEETFEYHVSSIRNETSIEYKPQGYADL